EADLALARRQPAADRLEHRRLPAARRAEQHEAVAWQHPEIDPPRGGDQVLRRAVLQGNALDLEERIHGGPDRRRARPFFRHPGESRDPSFHTTGAAGWIPAFAGMTKRASKWRGIAAAGAQLPGREWRLGKARSFQLAGRTLTEP